MPDWQHQLTKETVYHALQQTAGLAIEPSHKMHMRIIDGKPEARATAPPPGVTAIGAAVLVLLYHHDQQVHVVLTRRTTHLRSHAGQISFPGGRVDPQDPSFYSTAVREAQEEIDVNPAILSPWTELASVYVPPSNYQIHPFVAYCDRRPDFKPNLDEVHEVIEMPLRHLFLPESIATEERELAGKPIVIPHFHYQGHIIWGATAVILSHLVARIEAGLQLPKEDHP